MTEAALTLREFQELYGATHPKLTLGWFYRRIYDVNRKNHHLAPAFIKDGRTWHVLPQTLFRLMETKEGQ